MRRVVVTGLGCVSPCGQGTDASWEAVCNGRSGIGPIERFDCSEWSTQIAGEVSDFDPTTVLSPKELKRLDLFSQFGLVAAHEALTDAGLVEDELGDRAGVYVGSGIGGLGEIYDNALKLQAEGHRRLSPFFIPKSLTNLAAGHIALRHKARGPSLCVTTACATGNHSIGEAWRVIRTGDADVIIAGGTEAAIVPLGMAGFMAMKALSKRNDEPTRASRPFDVDRDGFVMGEGAGILILEELEHAKQRGARIYAEVVGYGITNDAHHITAPAPGGAGAVRCMKMALASGNIDPRRVGYINAHGTSTQANDVAETQAIKAVFGDHARELMISSTKSMTGHLLGAAGGIEAVFAAKALREGIVPPTINLENPDPGCDLDYVPNQAREVSVQAVMSNAFGFGGTNATIVLQRFEA